jgi:hypothetical protein
MKFQVLAIQSLLIDTSMEKLPSYGVQAPRADF